MVWYETSLSTSFSKTDAVDGKVISQWNDNNSQNSSKMHAFAGQKSDSTKISYNNAAGSNVGNTTGPTYIEDGINHLPALQFVNNNTAAYNYLAVDGRMRNIPQDSMMMYIVMRVNSGADNFLTDRVCINSSGVSVVCGASSMGSSASFDLVLSGGYLHTCIQNDAGTSFASMGFGCYGTIYPLKLGKTYILSLARDYNNIFAIYVNGALLLSKADSGEPITLAPYKIGHHVERDGEDIANINISEFIFFTGAMKKRDREEIDNYLGKKYDIPIIHNNVPIIHES